MPEPTAPHGPAAKVQGAVQGAVQDATHDAQDAQDALIEALDTDDEDPLGSVDGEVDDVLAREVSRIRQPGQGGVASDLHVLSAITGRRIAVCQPQSAGGFLVETIYGRGTDRPLVYLVYNRFNTHWWALTPTDKSVAQSAGGEARRVLGQEVECGAEGDCMYYALLMTLAPELMPLRPSIEATERRLARDMMLHLRRRLAARLVQEWHTPLSELSDWEDRRTLADVYASSDVPD